MPELPKKKVGIVACSGEDLAEGLVTRLSALKVLEQLRPSDTVTICLPLYLAGGEGDRAFARFYPTIAVDGCALRCAARATEMYSGKPASSLVVSDLVAERGLAKPKGRHRLDDAGMQVVGAMAEVMAFSGTGNPRSMAAGVSQATIPTMAGMVAALSGLFATTLMSRFAHREVERLKAALTTKR